MSTKYYINELDVIADVIGIFGIIPDESIETPFFKDKYGLPTSDNNEAVDKSHYFHTSYRLAKTNEEFEIVFDKCFSISNYTDQGVFLKRYIEAFQEREIEIKQFKAEDLESEYELIVKYLAFLASKATKNNVPIKNNNSILDPNPNIYELFNIGDIDLKNVMLKMIIIPFSFSENDKYFVIKEADSLKWNSRGKDGCNMVIAALIAELSVRLANCSFTDTFLIKRFTDEFRNIKGKSINKSRINNNHSQYIANILKSIDKN